MFLLSLYFFFSEINSFCQGLNKTNILLFITFFSYFGGFFPVVMYGCESWTVKKAER